MAPNNKKISQTKRLESIRRQLLKTDEVSIENLARKFKVSGMTIRRDLELLEAKGQVIRTHGGAALAKKLTFEFAFQNKKNKNQKSKQQIAKQALGHIKNGQVIMLDTGTTTLQIARQLSDQREVTIVTTSLAIVSELQFADSIEMVLLGGFLRRGSPDLHGPLTEENIGRFHADIAFMGADAIDNEGNVYADDLRVVGLDHKIASHAKRIVVVADSSKFAGKAMCKVLSPKDYDLIITDSKIDKAKLRQLTKRGINIKST
ncbi:MAG: DeoR/GlpR family DNA-binding transcription regulator [Planctomycetota bacterium]|jgi:DeoR/GlpR family transcriptional regulator of sugar metabolism